MSENMKSNVCNTCGCENGRCGDCGHYCGFRGGSIIRWVLGILVIVWVFSIGMRFGEIKSYLEMSGFGNSHMQYRTFPGPMQMQGWSTEGGNQVYFSQAVPATTVTSGTVTTGSAGTIKVVR